VGKRAKYDIPPEQFIRAWQSSENAAEVSKKLKMPKAIVQARASGYRALGIRLKKMPRKPTNKFNVDFANDIITEVNRDLGRKAFGLGEPMEAPNWLDKQGKEEWMAGYMDASNSRHR